MAVAPNPMQSFLWGAGGSIKTPEQVARDREIADALMKGGADYSPVAHWTQGLARASEGVMGGLESRWADEAEQAGMAQGKAAIDPVLQAIMGGSSGASAGGGAAAPMDISAGAPSYRDAISSIESAGSGNYGAVGPTDPRLGRALGKYQIMEANVGPWSKEALGRAVTPDEFLANPQIQDAVFDHQFGKYAQQYGPQGAAQAWFAGPGGVGKGDRRDSLGTSVSAYTDKFNNALGAGGAPTQVASLDPSIGMPDAGPVPLAPQMSVEQALAADAQGSAATAPRSTAPAQPSNGVLQALLAASGDPWARKQYGPVIDALLGQQLQQQDPAYRLGLEKSQLEVDALRNPRKKPIEVGGVLLDPDTLQPIFDSRAPSTATVGDAVIDTRTGQPIFQGGPKPTGNMQDYDAYAADERGAGRQPLSRLDYEKAVRSSGAASINVGDQGQKMGTIPAGMAAVPDPGNPSGFRLEAIPGGPAAKAIDDARTQAETGHQTKATAATIVVDDIDRALTQIDANPAMTTGVGAAVTKGVPGMPAYQTSALIDTVKANAGFDRLQAMRDASPTGGALGQVSEQENKLLQAAIGNLDPGQGTAQLQYNLKRVSNIYRDIIDGPGNGPRYDLKANGAPLVENGGAAAAGALPQGVTEDDVTFTMQKYHMTREQVLEKLNAP